MGVSGPRRRTDNPGEAVDGTSSIRGSTPQLGDRHMLFSRSGARPRHGRRSSWLALVALSSAALFAPASVSAHTPNVSLTCQNGLVVNLTQYNAGGSNTVAVSIDGSAVAGSPFSFTSSYSHTFAVTPPTASHTATVAINAWDDPTGSKGWTKTFNLSIAACVQATPEPTPTPTPEPTPTPTPEPTPTPTPEPTPTPTPTPEPTPTPLPTEQPREASILIAKVDNNGTADPADDVLLDGARFEVRSDDGDGIFEAGQDTLVFGPAEAADGLLDTDLVPGGMYWIVEAVVPNGFVGSDPILVELNLDPAQTCSWDAEGLIDCVPNQGPNEGLSLTVVIVNNTPIKQPTGAVGGATGTPRVTLPPSDTIDRTSSETPAGDGWRLIFLGMAGMLAAALVLTPARIVVRKVDRDR
jgi:hypothetical protein